MMILSKKVDGMNDNWMFERTPNGKPIANHYVVNDKRTYNRTLKIIVFESDEKGNNKYKELLKAGYKVIRKI